MMITIIILVPLHKSVCPGTHSTDWARLELKRSACGCLPGARTKGELTTSIPEITLISNHMLNFCKVFQFYFMCVLHLHICTSVYHLHAWRIWEPEKGIRQLETTMVLETELGSSLKANSTRENWARLCRLITELPLQLRLLYHMCFSYFGCLADRYVCTPHVSLVLTEARGSCRLSWNWNNGGS